MAGVSKQHKTRNLGRPFPASRYDDARGGRPCALERNILRFRAIEAALYLFYAEEIREFMLTTVYPAAMRQPGELIWQPPVEQRLSRLLADLLRQAEETGKATAADAIGLRQTLANERQNGKKLKVAFSYAVLVAILTEQEASELIELLDYRNDIAHRIHLVMADISRNNGAKSLCNYTEPRYKGEALDKLRPFRQVLWERAARQFVLCASMNGFAFELAEHVFEGDLRRLDRLINKQVAADRDRVATINAELDLRGTELEGDLAPRFSANHRPGRFRYSDDYIPPTGHLTKRGVEVCYRLFDLGKSSIAVAYLMGMTLRSAQRRRQTWLKAGGVGRAKTVIDRYDLKTMTKLETN